MGNFMHSLQGRLIGTLFVGLSMLALVVLLSLSSLKGNIDSYQAVVNNEGATLSAVDKMNLAFKTQVQEWKNVLLRGHSSSDLDKYWGQFQDRHSEVQDYARSLKATGLDSDIRAEIERFSDAHAQLLPQYRRGYEAFVASGFDVQEGDKQVRGIDREPSQLLSSISQKVDQYITQMENEYSQSSANALWIAVTVFVGISFLVLMGLSVALRGQLIIPLTEVVADLKRVADGDFSGQLNVRNAGEIGELTQSLSKMKRDLGGMIEEIRSTTGILRHASGEFSTSSQNIRRDTSQAESFSAQISEAVAQMASTITEVANNASNAADSTQEADRSANEGLSTMSGAIHAIANVSSEVARISAEMTKLEQDTTSVGAVLDVIKGIAEQTNLLALNAAIEAARAGEQGRGFAVVADEVRALAKRTQESTEEIQHIIETVQTGAASAAQAMQAGNEKAEGAAKLAEDAGGAIEQITRSIGQIRDMNNQIAAAAEEQSVAADEINRNVVNMTDMARNAHSSASNTEAATSSLESAASNLGNIVSRFKM